MTAAIICACVRPPPTTSSPWSRRPSPSRAWAPSTRGSSTLSLGTLTELIGTFAAPAERLVAVSEPYGAVTDDRPIIEYLLRSRLQDHRIPPELFDPRAVAHWCPRCFANGVPAAEVSGLPA